MNSLICAGATLLAVSVAVPAHSQVAVSLAHVGAVGNCSAFDTSGATNAATLDQSGETGNISCEDQDREKRSASLTERAP